MTTIIRLKYSKENLVDDGEYGATSEGNTTSGVKETLININCPLGSIIDHVRELTSLDEIDFLDEGACKLKNTLSYEPRTSGLEIFQPAITYRLVKIKRENEEKAANIEGTNPSRGSLETQKKNRKIQKKKSKLGSTKS